jgi:rare lipoprotein A
MTGLRRRLRAPLSALALALLAAGCAGRRADVAGDPGPGDREVEVDGHAVEGLASWYGPGFHGRATASGELYDSRDLTCAHRTLPFGTRVLVRNLENGRTCWVRVNDRGPFVDGRVIDLSYSAASALDIVRPGTARVAIELGGAGDEPAAAPVASIAVAPAASERAPEPDPAATPAEPAAGGYAVQVGAFALRENAERLAADLARRGIDARVLDDGHLSRVRVTSAASEPAAAQLAETLRHDGFEAIVVGP